jgi:hypothetical protein
MAAQFAAYQQQAFYHYQMQQHQQHMHMLAQQQQQQQPPQMHQQPGFVGVEAKLQGAWADKPGMPPPPAPPPGPPPGMPMPPPPGIFMHQGPLPAGVDLATGLATGRTVFVHPSQLVPPPANPPQLRPPMPLPNKQRAAGAQTNAAPAAGGKGAWSGKGGKGGKGGGASGVVGYHSASFVPIPPQVPTRGKLMTGRDVASVLHVHLRSLEISDPYSEDFYYHHFQLKARARAASQVGGFLLNAPVCPRVCACVLLRCPLLSLNLLPVDE